MLFVMEESHLFSQLQVSQVLHSVCPIKLLLLCILDLDQLLADLLCIDGFVQSREDFSVLGVHEKFPLVRAGLMLSVCLKAATVLGLEHWVLCLLS